MSDIAFKSGAFPTPLPFCGGHEPVGVVEQLGSAVRGFKVGDRVGFQTVSDCCMNCMECDSGNNRYCSARRTLGASEPYGGFSDYCLTKAPNTVRLPDGLTDEIAAPLTCAGVTAYSAVKKLAAAQPGGTVVNIIGAGGVGHLAIQYAKAMGYTVHACEFTDTLLASRYIANLLPDDITEEKLQLAKDCGAAKAFNSLSLDDKALVPGSGTIVVSGAEPAYALAFKITAMHGRIVAIGLPRSNISVSIAIMARKDLSLVAVNQGSKNELAECLEVAVSHGIKPLYQTREFDQLNEGINEMMAGKVDGRLVYKMS